MDKYQLDIQVVQSVKCDILQLYSTIKLEMQQNDVILIQDQQQSLIKMQTSNSQFLDKQKTKYNSNQFQSDFSYFIVRVNNYFENSEIQEYCLLYLKFAYLFQYDQATVIALYCENDMNNLIEKCNYLNLTSVKFPKKYYCQVLKYIYYQNVQSEDTIKSYVEQLCNSDCQVLKNSQKEVLILCQKLNSIRQVNVQFKLIQIQQIQMEMIQPQNLMFDNHIINNNQFNTDPFDNIKANAFNFNNQAFMTSPFAPVQTQINPFPIIGQDTFKQTDLPFNFEKQPQGDIVQNNGTCLNTTQVDPVNIFDILNPQISSNSKEKNFLQQHNHMINMEKEFNQANQKPYQQNITANKPKSKDNELVIEIIGQQSGEQSDEQEEYSEDLAKYINYENSSNKKQYALQLSPVNIEHQTQIKLLKVFPDIYKEHIKQNIIIKAQFAFITFDSKEWLNKAEDLLSQMVFDTFKFKVSLTIKQKLTAVFNMNVEKLDNSIKKQIKIYLFKNIKELKYIDFSLKKIILSFFSVEDCEQYSENMRLIEQLPFNNFHQKLQIKMVRNYDFKLDDFDIFAQTIKTDDINCLKPYNDHIVYYQKSGPYYFVHFDNLNTLILAKNQLGKQNPLFPTDNLKVQCEKQQRSLLDFYLIVKKYYDIHQVEEFENHFAITFLTDSFASSVIDTGKIKLGDYVFIFEQFNYHQQQPIRAIKQKWSINPPQMIDYEQINFTRPYFNQQQYYNNPNKTNQSQQQEVKIEVVEEQQEDNSSEQSGNKQCETPQQEQYNVDGKRYCLSFFPLSIDTNIKQFMQQMFSYYMKYVIKTEKTKYVNNDNYIELIVTFNNLLAQQEVGDLVHDKQYNGKTMYVDHPVRQQVTINTNKISQKQLEQTYGISIIREEEDFYRIWFSNDSDMNKFISAYGDSVKKLQIKEIQRPNIYNEAALEYDEHFDYKKNVKYVQAKKKVEYRSNHNNMNQHQFMQMLLGKMQ